MYIGPVILEVEESRGPQMRSSASYSIRHRFDGALEDAQRAQPETRSPAPVPSVYQVQSGDTLTGIVQQQLKAAGRSAKASEVYEQVRRVARHNGLRDLDRLHVGQSLDLAPLFKSESSGSSVSPSANTAPAKPPMPSPPLTP